MLPIIDNWLVHQPWYAGEQTERKMVIAFAMDKGRVDYPLVSERVKNWHAVTTVGDRHWLRRRIGGGMEVVDPSPQSVSVQDPSEELGKLHLAGELLRSAYRPAIASAAETTASSSAQLGVLSGRFRLRAATQTESSGTESSTDTETDEDGTQLASSIARAIDEGDEVEATSEPPRLDQVVQDGVEDKLKKEDDEDETKEAYWNSAKWIDPVFRYSDEKRLFRELLGVGVDVEDHTVDVDAAVKVNTVAADVELPLTFDPCWNQTSVSKRAFLYYPQDVVVPVPTAFYFDERAASSQNRTRLLFYAASVNSCTRRLVSDVARIKKWNQWEWVEEFLLAEDHNHNHNHKPQPEPQQLQKQQEAEASSQLPVRNSILVLDKVVERDVWRSFMYETKYCLVPDGFSSVSARLYEVILHGCVPVLITDAFHGAFEHSVPWLRFAVFVSRRDVPRIPDILVGVSEAEYLRKFETIRSIHAVFHEETGQFWAALFRELEARKRRAWGGDSDSDLENPIISAEEGGAGGRGQDGGEEL